MRQRARLLLAGAGAALALTLMTPGTSAEEYGPDLETYLGLIERYRDGDVAGPVADAGDWGPVWTRATVRRLLEWCRDAPGGGGTAQVRAAQGAFLLHTHAALAGSEMDLRPLDHEAHVAAALELLRWFRGRYRNPGAWPSEAQGLRPRDFYLALASGVLVRGARFEEAREVARESLATERRDGEMRLLAGCTWDTEALVRRQRRGEWHDGTLRKAESRYREALEDDPTLQAARLRLGWVLVRRGHPHEAQPFLRTVAEASVSPGQRALAWLFLGAALEGSDDVSAAVGAYREAVEIAPHLQAAQMGLAHALELDAGDQAARAVLQSFFESRSHSWVREDPWNDYPYGPPALRLRPFGALVERLCRP